MTISQRVFYLLKKQDKKQNELSKFTGISTSTISAWNKRGTDPSANIISTLADFFEVSTDYLLTGKETNSPSINDLSDDEQELLDKYKKLSKFNKGKVLGTIETLAEIEEEKRSKPIASSINYIYIDIYEMPVSAGTGIDLSGYDKGQIKIKQLDEAELADFCLRISGDSMEPDYHHGDIVLVRGCPAINIGEIGIFVVNGSGFIKKLGRNKLISLNDNYKDIILNENDSVWCMGEVLGILDPEDIL